MKIHFRFHVYVTKYKDLQTKLKYERVMNPKAFRLGYESSNESDFR